MLLIGIIVVGLMVIFLPSFILPFLKKENNKLSERFCACVFKYDNEWYAYYCPGGTHDAVSVGPCLNKNDGLDVLASISKCDNIMCISNFIVTEMPPNLPKKPAIQLLRDEMTEYITPIPFHIAIGKWGDMSYPAFSSLV